MTTNFTINGEKYAVNLLTLPPDTTLNTFIRENAQLTATKNMCLEGGCGACVCAVKGKDPVTGKVRIWAANSCLTLLNTCADWEIITSEGIGNKRKGYHPIQKRLAKLNGTQCGYCSPGFVMNMYALLESKANNVTMQEIENSLGGNICRCTGYRPILDTMKSFAVDTVIDVPKDCGDIEDVATKLCSKSGLVKCNGTRACHQQNSLTSLLYDDGSQWYWPKTLEDALKALKSVGDTEYMLVAGNTAHGVYRRSPNIKAFINVNNLAELKKHKIENGTLTLGGNLSLTDAMNIFTESSKTSGFEYCQQLWNHFDLIANVPVRNTGTLAGNLSIKRQHPEFPSDIFLLFEALNAQVVVASGLEDKLNPQKMPLMEFILNKSEKLLILAFELQAYPKDKYVFHSYKIMPRAQNAHAYVNAAFLLDMNMESGQINSARVCFGGIRPDFVHASDIEKMLTQKSVWGEKDLLGKIFEKLQSILHPDSVLPDSSPEYRKTLACGLLYKFFLNITPKSQIKAEYQSGAELLTRPLSSGIQNFKTNKKSYPVTEPVEKVEGQIQCSGEATYMNDVITTQNTVYCAFVTAKKVGATIESIDASAALEMPGVIAFYSAKDIPGKNAFFDKSFDTVDEELFCTDKVMYYDQPLGVIAAKTSDIAYRAANEVKVMYTKGSKTVYPTLNSVLELRQHHRIHSMTETPFEYIQLFADTDVSGSGVFDIGAQYHFTMEPHTAVVVPFEDGLQVWSATQCMDHTQLVIANMLNMKVSDVQLKVRRLGGAYGAKITRGNPVACAASLVAHKLNRPTRFVQRIESMMTTLGKRWACRSEYEFHVAKNAKILRLKNLFFEDAGCSLNENPIGHHAMHMARNCYQFTDHNYQLEGNAVLTDAPSATWCRAPGSVEGIAMIENIMDHLAFAANVDPVDARLVNLKPGHKMNNLLPDFIKKTEYRKRRKEIEDFNAKNRWRKRGIGIALMEYNVGYFGQFPATVAIYHGDGTVVITHGGIEMGQGLNTKIAQVAAYVLGIPLSLVKIESSDTINGANSSVTGGAIGSESVCFAVKKCCNTLNDRLAPIKASLPKNSDWKTIVGTAYSRTVNLIVSDQYKEGDMQGYEVYGVGLTEVEVDMLTGNLQIKRVDILEDAGESLSPYVDIGQVEGSFVMLLGYWLMEELVYNRETGELLTNRTWNYKVPGVKDIPIDFRVELLQNNPNPAGFMRSKATGEPPCCLAVSVIFALQQAMQSARNDAGLPKKWVPLSTPITPEFIVLNSGARVESFSLQ